MMARLGEILPGLMVWLTLLGLIFLSWQWPSGVAIFIIFFDLYWLLKSFYLLLHLYPSFTKLKANLKINWLEKLTKELPNKWQKIYHLVILPMYKENYEIVHTSLKSLAQANYPKDKFIIVLATEETAGPTAQEAAEKIKKEFGQIFFSFLITVHPANKEGEMPGKGSNETWAIKKIKRDFIDVKKIPYENILTSVFDIDTRVGKNYFGILTYTFFTTRNAQHSSFQPIPLFTNNLRQAPIFSRLVAFTSTFWQMMQHSRPERLITFSSHSMPFKALTEIGFWPTNIVSEDSRIFFQCLNYYNGDWRVTPVTYPVYMDAVASNRFWQSLANLYKQQRRWAWGAENFSFLLKNLIPNKQVKLSQKISWSFMLLAGFCSWAVSSLIIFLFGWLPIILGRGDFQTSILSYHLPRITGWLLNISIVGIISSAFLSLLILPPKLPWLKKYHYPFYFLQWLLMPLTFIIFGSLPALEALTRLMLNGKLKLGFWTTPKLKEKIQK